MIPEERLSLAEFHGHMGPYLYIGYRMGKLALGKIMARGKRLKAEVRSGLTTPLSCIIDGVQFSSGCTLGKGNLSVADEGRAEVVFRGEKSLVIRLRDPVKEDIDGSGAADGLVEKLGKMSDEQLFEVD